VYDGIVVAKYVGNLVGFRVGLKRGCNEGVPVPFDNISLELVLDNSTERKKINLIIPTIHEKVNENRKPLPTSFFEFFQLLTVENIKKSIGKQRTTYSRSF
jgi:hypothetical protein